jgi:glycosyltransferase involved in cell wall biosynthesis
VKILHLFASPFWSGPAETIALLALAQRRLGHEVLVAVDTKRRHASAEELAVPRFDALGLRLPGGLTLSVKALGSFWRDVRALKRLEADVVHAHFSHDHWVARLGRPRGATLVRSFHAPRSLRRPLPRADGFTVPPGVTAPSWLKGPVMPLPPLVDEGLTAPVDRASARREAGLDGAPLIGMVSTFQPSRRHALGLEAFARLRRQSPSARLVLAGDGALEADLRAQAKGLGLDGAVTFTGYLAQARYAQVLRALDEVWVLGLGNDWSARVAAQARACGVRVVAVPEGGLTALADALVTELSPDAVVAASTATSRRAVETSSNTAIAERVLALYQEAAR